MSLPAALLAFAARADAQTFRVDTLYQPTPLQGIWKMHPGDDLRWADPARDDSSWNHVSMPEQHPLPIWPRRRSA